MTSLQLLTVTYSGFGAVGSALTVFGSWSLEPGTVAFYAGRNYQELEAARAKRNARRLWTQRGGLLLILIAFLLQGSSAFVSG